MWSACLVDRLPTWKAVCTVFGDVKCGGVGNEWVTYYFTTIKNKKTQTYFTNLAMDMV